MTSNFNNNSGIQWGRWQKTFFKHIVKEFSRSQEIQKHFSESREHQKKRKKCCERESSYLKRNDIQCDNKLLMTETTEKWVKASMF